MRSPWYQAVRPARSMTASWRQPMVGSSRVREAIASAAVSPASSRSRPRGPRRASVRCWVRTAPTPDLAQGQRAPTLMLDVLTAAPEHAGAPAHADERKSHFRSPVREGGFADLIAATWPQTRYHPMRIPGRRVPWRPPGSPQASTCGARSANQPFKQETGQLPACIEDGHDMHPIHVISIDDPPWPFNQFPVGEDIYRPQLGNDAAALRQCREGSATSLQSRERSERVRSTLLGNELDDSFEVESRRVCPQDLEVSHPWSVSSAPRCPRKLAPGGLSAPPRHRPPPAP